MVPDRSNDRRNIGGRLTKYGKIKISTYRKRVNTAHCRSGYSRVILAGKRAIPDDVKSPYNSTCRINSREVSIYWSE